MAIVQSVEDGSICYFIGSSMQVLRDFAETPEGKKFKSWEMVLIRDAKALGPGVEKINKAKEDIREGRAKVLELGPPNIIVFS